MTTGQQGDFKVNKELVSATLGSLGWIIPVWIVILLWHPPFWIWFVLVPNLILVQMIYSWIKNRKAPDLVRISKVIIEAELFMLALLLLNLWLGAYGLLGTLIIVFAIAFYRVWRNWKLFNSGLDSIIAQIENIKNRRR